jgi:BNR/Asp-box repeat
MRGLKYIWLYLLLSATTVLFATVLFQPLLAASPQNSGASSTSQQPERDGQHDFDFELGTWKTHLKLSSRLGHPFTGADTWSVYEGTSVVRKIWNGKGNIVELEVDGPTGHVEGLNLRLYNPQSHQWSLNFANSRVGTVGVPTVGEFKNGRGEFYDQEAINGKVMLVRNVWSDITPDSCHFEQAFSDDGGKTWETNWVATDTRVTDESATGGTSLPQNAAERDGQHGFDFSHGNWKTHIRRLQQPLSGSTTWMEYEGTSVVRKIWNGRASLGETEADGPAGHLEALSLRLYSPESRQWNLYYASSGGTTSTPTALSVPTIGEFKNGRGEFFDTELFRGRNILVRNVWSDMTPDSCHFEQAFSEDGGKTWEVNWIATDTRVSDESDKAQ